VFLSVIFHFHLWPPCLLVSQECSVKLVVQIKLGRFQGCPGEFLEVEETPLP
jgi:hypothetical protein